MITKQKINTYIPVCIKTKYSYSNNFTNYNRQKKYVKSSFILFDLNLVLK